MSIAVQIDNKLPSCSVVSVLHSCYTKVSPSAEVENPQLVAWSDLVEELLDLDPKEFERPDFMHFFSRASPLVGGCYSYTDGDSCNFAEVTILVDLQFLPIANIPIGLNNKDVTEAIQKVAAYDCKIVEGVLSHQMKQFVIDGNKVVLSVPGPQTKVDEAEFKENEVNSIDIVTSTGEGKEQAAKEAAALASKKDYEAAFANCSGDVEVAQRLAAAAAEAVAKSKKEKQQKRAADLKNMGPAQTAHEAAKQALDRKSLGSKIRLDALEKLFDESVNLILDFGILEKENPVDTKKSRTEAESDHDDKYPNNIKDDTEAS
ncbi:proliferation-associated protein a [Phtheirospermum japonicum]|uniref:Proliferation-associated protein a n=1 Tax=Phtheirospermum japonicum TaxID=374723 RepID=A0A830BAK1_9LAMI|nr:proliferation-associated protein a [Phtheirospermum japonicum]